jgi:hypothetical protein
MICVWILFLFRGFVCLLCLVGTYKSFRASHTARVESAGVWCVRQLRRAGVDGFASPLWPNALLATPTPLNEAARVRITRYFSHTFTREDAPRRCPTTARDFKGLLPCGPTQPRQPPQVSTACPGCECAPGILLAMRCLRRDQCTSAPHVGPRQHNEAQELQNTSRLSVAGPHTDGRLTTRPTSSLPSGLARAPTLQAAWWQPSWNPRGRVVGEKKARHPHSPPGQQKHRAGQTLYPPRPNIASSGCAHLPHEPRLVNAGRRVGAGRRLPNDPWTQM